MLYVVEEKEKRTYINASSVTDSHGNMIPFSSYSISPSTTYALLLTASSKEFRHSFLARYVVHSLESGDTFNLRNTTEPDISNIRWSPNGQQSLLAFVRANDIYIVSLQGSSISQELQVTTDGSLDAIQNGICDWVYEEEIYAGYNAMWWSPDGSKLAYLRFNDTQVHKFSFPIYTGDSYPNEETIRYPKAGFTNPTVSLAVFHLATNQTVFMNFASFEMEYVTSVIWDGPSLIVTLLNRTQNFRRILKFNDTSTGAATELASQTENPWIDEEPIVLVPNTDYFVTIQNDPSGYDHIAKYSKTDGTFLSYLTSGHWDVISIAAVFNNTVYYISAEVSPLERQLYSISVDGTGKARMSNQEGWYSATFDPRGQYYLLNYGGPKVPTLTLYSTLNNGFSIPLVTNEDLANKLSKYALPTKKFITVPIGNEKDMNGYLLLPPDFNDKQQYPVLVHVYGGPGSQTVTKAFDQIGFHTYVASQLGFIVASFDGRGTGARGNRWQKQTYWRLGQLESEDQLIAAQYLQSLPYVDRTTIGIWGWSYGGFMTCTVMSAQNTPFKFGMSVAPVTDWRFYDSVYTERYMRTPSQNVAGYNETSVLNRVSNIKDFSLLLAHGTGDDNVHFQNTAELVKVLIEKGIQFDLMFYTNRDHGITGQGARPHLYHLLSNYLNSHLAQ